jgi:hypothetical protein
MTKPRPSGLGRRLLDLGPEAAPGVRSEGEPMGLGAFRALAESCRLAGSTGELLPKPV